MEISNSRNCFPPFADFIKLKNLKIDFQISIVDRKCYGRNEGGGHGPDNRHYVTVSSVQFTFHDETRVKMFNN